MTTHHVQADTDDKPLTKREEAHVKELEHLAEKLKQENLLYGSALDGMEPGLNAVSDALAGADIDTKMGAVEREVSERVRTLLTSEAEEADALDGELDADDEQEARLLEEDAAGPA